MKQDKAEYCPYCLTIKVVKNGIKTTGMQNFKWKECGKQFQSQYLYQGADKRVKDKLLQMQLRGCGIRDTALLAGVSPATVLNCIISESL